MTFKPQFAAAVVLSVATVALAHPATAQTPATPAPFIAGQPLGTPGQDGAFTPMSSNVKVYGAVVSAESCSYDPVRNLIVLPNRGVNQDQVPNDGFVSLINHDGSVHTSRWIGVNRNGLILNQPFGSDIVNGVLYVADRDGGTRADDPTVSVVRKFNMTTGAPAGEIRNPQSTGLNDIAVAADGTVYGTQTGTATDATSWKVFKLTAAGVVSELIVGAPLRQPNGIALDRDGNIVVINIGSNDVLTFSLTGQLLKTETAVQAGNDGLVIMPDGTKYVSSVINGGVSRIRPGQTADLIAQNIPSPASMCYDSGANQLVIPMNANNAIALIPLR